MFSIRALVASATLGLLLAAPSWALSFAGGTYSQNFNTLASTPATGNAWSDDTTLPGWYSSRTTYNASAGTNNDGGLYSFGPAGNSDRALGGIASNGTNAIYYGLMLTNDTNQTLTSATVSFVGEQWRTGGISGVANAVSVAQTVDFMFGLGNANLGIGPWTDVNALDFTSPVFGTSAASSVNGNDAANRIALSQNLSLTWQPGQVLWLRWRDANDTNNDHGLGIDDFSFTSNVPVIPPVTPVPEPATLGVIGLLAVALGLRRRR